MLFGLRFLGWMLLAIIGSLGTCLLFGIESNGASFLIGMIWGGAAGIAHIATSDPL